MKKIILIVAVLVIIALMVFFSKRDTDVSAEEIRLGAVLSLSGEAAADGLNIKRGIDLAVADLAEEGVNVKVEYQESGRQLCFLPFSAFKFKRMSSDWSTFAH